MEEDQEDISQFKELREVLTCGICYEILNTPVITACSHTYCSICIRRWLSSKQECPSCAVTIYESSLRKNTIVVNILDAVRNLKKRLFGRKNAVLQSSKSSSSTCPTSAKIEGDDFQPKSTARMTIKSTPPKTPIQNHSAQPKKTPILLPKTPSQKFPRVEVNSTPGGGNPPPLNDQSPGNKVQCPVCNSMMAQSLVNSHLDRCLLEPKTPSSESLKSPTPKINHAAKTSSNSAESNPSLQPIKKKVYNLMSDKQVKTELRKYGLPIQGDRSTLLSRLKRFVILHNAECDSDTPKTLSEIKLHLEKEEKAIASASAASTFSQMFKKTDNPREIESAHQQYRAQQKDSYQKLIEDVKKRSKHKPSKKEECIILSETEDDPPPIPVPQHEPVPESAASRRVDTDCDKSRLIANHSNASDSDLDIGKTTSRRKTIKNVKRKCIESESEEDEDLTRQVKQLKQAEESTSPVLSRRTPARQLRSGTARSKAVQKRCILPPQTQTVKRNSQRAKQPPEQVLERGGGEDELSSSSDEEMLTKRSTGVKQVKQRSPTPDMFDSCSPASSILFPCGQKARTDDSGNEALSELVTMIDDDGSTTEYDD